MSERDRLSDTALALCYAISAVVIVALYRDPLAALGRDVGRWYARQAISRPMSVRWFRGRLWADVNAAIDGR